MKAIKIGLAIVVLTAIGFFVFNSLGEPPPPPPPPAESKNEFVNQINKKIDAIESLPNSEFAKAIYNEIKYLIEDRAKPHPPKYRFGRLGESRSENNQQKENLMRNLYSAYVDKFIEQAFHVFGDTLWSTSDLTFIRSEYQTLRRSPYLESGSPVDDQLGYIQGILKKFDEINRFILQSTSIQFPDPSTFPGSENDTSFVERLNSKLDSIETYRNVVSRHNYLRNCARLRKRLVESPKVIFGGHVQYLDERITLWSGFYERYNSQATYAQQLYTPIKDEIDVLIGDLYENTSVNPYDEHQRLLVRWNRDAEMAFDKFNSE